jgi:hypothetical protein
MCRVIFFLQAFEHALHLARQRVLQNLRFEICCRNWVTQVEAYTNVFAHAPLVAIRKAASIEEAFSTFRCECAHKTPI